MAISILTAILPEEVAEAFDQEPSDLVATLLALAELLTDEVERQDFLKVFGVSAQSIDPEAQMRVYDLLIDMAAAVEERV